MRSPTAGLKNGNNILAAPIKIAFDTVRQVDHCLKILVSSGMVGVDHSELNTVDEAVALLLENRKRVVTAQFFVGEFSQRINFDFGHFVKKLPELGRIRAFE